jgi:hypothetical protein
MAASRLDVNRWIETAKKQKAKYIISVCDTFDYDDYPVYCADKKELNEKLDKYDGKNMQRINEIIEICDDGTVRENVNI